MRWLLIVLLISVGALLTVAGAVVRHIRLQKTAAQPQGVETGQDSDDRKGDV